MIYRIMLDDKEIDRQQWPGLWHLQAVQLEEYCEDHDYELVKTRPNSTFTEISVTVRRVPSGEAEGTVAGTAARIAV